MSRTGRPAPGGARPAAPPLPLELPAVVAEQEEPKPQLSPLRVAVAVAVVGGLGFGGYAGLRAKLAPSSSAGQATFFAPYVDVTLTPTYQFQSPASNPARQSVLGFVVASSPGSCTPSWGAAYDLAQANQRIALRSRIAQLRGYGAAVVVSFGGAAHTSLDVACPSATALAGAYQSVIDTYGLSTIDLDVEGAALDSFAAERRRSAAVRILEDTAAREHRTLHVWLTLPVEPGGLQDNASSVVRAMLASRDRLTGIDVMAMDFATPPAGGATMLDEVERALTSTDAQLTRLLPRYGIELRPAQVWRRLGVTVMIGQNDVQGEHFTTADASGLVAFVRGKGMGRLSMWSLNRDQPCGASFGPVLSTTCSGTAQSGLQFADTFRQLQGVLAPTASGSGILRAITPDTNPANAPFPTWSPVASYPAAYKVVENGEIYQAKWYNSAQDPEAAYQYSWQSPWELLGPVLPSDHAPVIAAPAPGTYRGWSATTLYVAGQRVVYDRLAYQAKWSNQGVAPGIDAVQEPSSPWQPLYVIPGEPVLGG